MATIELKHICKRFAGTPKPGFEEVVNPFAAITRVMKKVRSEMTSNVPQGAFMMENLTLTIPDGKTIVILGPSGCGKSTLLRIIAGLMQPDAGDVLYDGVSVLDIPPGDRQIGMVFQDYALYPHMTSRKNLLSYFLFKKRTPELDAQAQEKYRKTSELLGVDIEYLMGKKPAHLSGGEKQRIALGRCITRDPKLFLLDEPFSNLDQQLREKYRIQLKKLLRHFKITTVYVTHDQQEALILADLLVIMNIGTIAQIGTAEEIYNHPDSIFVAEFLNPEPETPAINLLEGETLAEELRGNIVGVRSEDIEVSQDNLEYPMTGTIHDIRHVPVKKATVLTVAVGKNDLTVRIPLNPDLSENNRVRLRFNKFHLFDKDSGCRIRTDGG